MTYDASDRKDIRKAEKSARIAENNRIAYTRRILSELEGREWMHALLLRCNVFTTPFVAQAHDITSFNCGMQNLGLQLFWDVVTHCPDQYVMMMREQAAKEGIENARGSRTDTAAAAAGAGTDTGRDDQGSEPGTGDDTEGGREPDPASFVDSEGFVKH